MQACLNLLHPIALTEIWRWSWAENEIESPSRETFEVWQVKEKLAVYR